MNNIYRLYTNKTIAFFSHKDDAISLLYSIPNAKIEVFNNLTPIGIYQLNNKKLYFNDELVLLEGYMKKWFEQNIKEEIFIEKKGEFDKEKKNFEREKESWNQLKNKLEADKRVYFIIKEQLDSGELTEESIPILFIDKYPIFKYLDEKNLIDNSDSISTDEINNYLQIAPNYKINISIDNSNSFNDLFSSSDPIYFNKEKNVTSDSST